MISDLKTNSLEAINLNQYPDLVSSVNLFNGFHLFGHVLPNGITRRQLKTILYAHGISHY